MQNLPGVTNQLEFSANKLGTFPGRCNILCGRNHSQMLFTVKVVTPTEYQTYIDSNINLKSDISLKKIGKTN
jgi:cytochrome c oxidase subunit 2